MNRRDLFVKTIGAMAAGVVALLPVTAKASPAFKPEIKQRVAVPHGWRQIGDRRIFYVDFRNVSKADQERFMQRMRDQFRKAKKKV